MVLAILQMDSRAVNFLPTISTGHWGWSCSSSTAQILQNSWHPSSQVTVFPNHNYSQFVKTRSNLVLKSRMDWWCRTIVWMLCKSCNYILEPINSIMFISGPPYSHPQCVPNPGILSHNVRLSNNNHLESRPTWSTEWPGLSPRTTEKNLSWKTKPKKQTHPSDCLHTQYYG